MSEKLDGIRACVFDAYGTLFDVHSAVERLKDRVGPEATQVSEVWRVKQLEYTWLRALMGRHVDFWQVTSDALDYALETFGVDDGTVRDALLDAYKVLDAYPEVDDVLSRLKQRGLKTAILSNGEPAMLQAAAGSAGIAGLLDHLLSVEEVGIYKPAPVVYQLAVDSLGVPPAAIAFQSSNPWDVHGAAAFGFRAVWINRRHLVPERLPGTPSAMLHDLRGLSDLID
ncbi:MAG: haloacid dehalogenase type II [Geminicoccaceae bacterium]|nr:haloacid dehalogenase type II [Geminicoccaceae bacterium]